MTHMKPIAAIYIRVSTTAQSGPDKSSLDSQFSECMALAQRGGYEVPYDLVFRDIMSGRREDRPGFRAMMAAAQAKRFSRLFVWSVDRLGRSLGLSVNAVEGLKAAGVIVESFREGDMSDTMRLGILATFAAREIERLQERTLPARKAKREAGLFVDGREPFGYRRKADKSLEKCPIESIAVRRIFRDSSMGMGGRQISRRLNLEGVLPPEVRVKMPDGRIRRIRPAHIEADHGTGAFARWRMDVGAEIDGLPEWTSVSVNRVLKNPAAYGSLDTRGPSEVRLLIHGGPIITRAEYDDAQAAAMGRKWNGRRPSTPWLLTGLMVCGNCGGSYRHKAAKGNMHHYYRCHAHMEGKSCQSPSVPMASADKFVIKMVREHLYDRLGGPEKIRQHVLAEALRDRNEVAAQIAELEKRLVGADLLWSEAQDTVGKLVQAGADLTALPAILANVAQARNQRQAIASSLGAAIDRRNLIDSGLAVSSRELDAVVARVSSGLQLIEGDGVEQENVADVVFILRALVEKVVVGMDKSLLVVIRHDPAALFTVFADLLRAAIEGHRIDEALGTKAS